MALPYNALGRASIVPMRRRHTRFDAAVEAAMVRLCRATVRPGCWGVPESPAHKPALSTCAEYCIGQSTSGTLRIGCFGRIYLKALNSVHSVDGLEWREQRQRGHEEPREYQILQRLILRQQIHRSAIQQQL